jgi:DNA-binding CsgD family transcriptional regulator
LLKKISSSQKINAEIINECEEDCFNETMQIAIYKITQEILSNTIKHAKASRISISFTKKGQNIELVFIDNGTGIKPEDIEKSAGIGWKNIYSRLEILKGEIDILSKKEIDDNRLVADGIKISPREKEILKLLAEGMKAEEIAMALGLVRYTIEEYRSNLIKKFRAKNTTHLIKIACDYNFI